MAAVYIYLILVNSLFIGTVSCGVVAPDKSIELRIFKVVGDIVLANYKDDGFPGILFYGPMPDELYEQLKQLNLSHVRLNSNYLSNTLEDTVPYQINTAVMSCSNYSDFGEALSKVTILPYWNPHAKVFLYIRAIEDPSEVAKVFYAFWWYQCLNVFILNYEESRELLWIYKYTPYAYDRYMLDTSMTCRSSKTWTVGYSVKVIANYIICEDDCSNQIKKKYSRKKLPACISFNKLSARLDNITKPQVIMQDLTENLHGFPLKAIGPQLPPFLQISLTPNGAYEMHKRDGEVWNTLAKNMNFTIQVYPEEFSYIKTTQYIFDMSFRGDIDIIPMPVYQYDVVITKMDLLFPIRASGVCIIAHRARFEAQWFDTSRLTIQNLAGFYGFFISVWFTFSVFKYFELNRLSLDQLGKDFCNAMRNLLIVPLHKPPLQESFLIYQGVSLWCFFVLSFLFQASIVSFLTAAKRGKDVDTFKEIADLGYPIKSFRSPDMFLPETNEIFTKINSLQEDMEVMFECVSELENNSRLFCMLDCTLANYLEKNRLDSTGEPYMHVIKDKIHSLFLNMAMPWKSPLSRNMNKYLMFIFEGGLVMKWEDYRYDKIHEDAHSAKPLSLSDLGGMFQTFLIVVGMTIGVFALEVMMGSLGFLVKYIKTKMYLWRAQKGKLKCCKGSVGNVDASTQTFFI